MKKVCFVCLGNICRSPMAEFVMKDLAKGRLDVRSRGTSNWEHGNPIHSGTQQVLLAHEIPYDKHKTSQQIRRCDLEACDYIFALDSQNYQDLLELSAGAFDSKIFLLGDQSVPDPWYTGDFEETYALISKACRQWLSRIMEQEI